LRANKLPPWSFFAVAAAAGLAAWFLIDVAGLLGGGRVLAIVVAVILFVGGMGALATVVEGRRSGRNRVATALIYGALTLPLLPLLSVAFTLLSKGLDRIDMEFFTHSNKGITAFDSGGGINHAIIGTIEQVGIATLITVPLGIMGAIYIVEYGRGRLAA